MTSPGRPFDLLHLHGFWGDQYEADEYLRLVKESGWFQRILTPKLYQYGALGPESDLASWTYWMSKDLERRWQRPIILSGYSMGGRLGLHLLHQIPQLFAGALIFSAHPGGMTELELGDRESWERLWQDRFLNEPLEQLEALWNSQKIFASSAKAKNCLQDPWLLACSLRNWSVTRHIFSREQLSSAGPLPIFWLAGEQDEKYATLYRLGLKAGWIRHLKILEGVGHRVPIEAPTESWDTLRTLTSEVHRLGLIKRSNQEVSYAEPIH